MSDVPVALQAHLDQDATTTTRLLKIKLKDGTVFGLSALDKDIAYDDGTPDGEITYTAMNGFDPSNISAGIDYSIANSEARALISDLVPSVDLEMVESGEFDDAAWTVYVVNFMDLSMGHITLDAGDLGEVTAKHDMIWIPELLSYMMRLKQPIGAVWSRSCRAIFGSSASSQTGCGVDLAPLWVAGTVQYIGAETDRIFTGDYVTDVVAPFPGRVQFLTGDNAGKEFATEEIDGLVVSLSETTAYPIQIGDTYRIRPDCRKRYEEDCIGLWNNGVNFKGEPLIPTGDASQVLTPGAQLPGGGGFHGQKFATED